MTAKRTDDAENTQGHCADHSGMVTWRTGVVAILLALLGINSYQTFKQVPDMRYEMAQNNAAANLRMQAIEYRVSALEQGFVAVGKVRP